MIRLLPLVGVVFALQVGSANAWRTGEHRAYRACQHGYVKGCVRRGALKYRQSFGAMLAVARCESNLNPRAYNRSSGASGLFQFLPSTYRSTPYGGHSIFSAKYSALAAGWMWAHGRRGEWVC